MKFADAIQIIANVVDVEPTPAFVSQIRNYQKMGIWPDIRTGRGHSAEYSLDTVFQICIFLTLIEAGLFPFTVEAMVRDHDLWEKIDQAVRDEGCVEVFAGALAPYGGKKPYVRVVQPEDDTLGIDIWPAPIAEAVANYFKLRLAA